MPPKNSTRTSMKQASESRLKPDAPLHMTTRAASHASQPRVMDSQSPSNVSQTVGGDDVDQTRPAKRSKLSPLPSGDAVMPSPSSPLSFAAGGERPEQLDGYNSDLESSEDIVDGIEDVHLRYDALDADQSQLPSRTISESNRSSPDALDSELPSPIKGSMSPTKPIDQLNNTHGLSDDNGLERATPDLDEPGGILKRLPGRRRAPHPDVNVEIDLRRQLELKVAYRAVAKALKPMLAELADRTARELEADEERHQAYPEYDRMITELDHRLSQRIASVQASLREEEARFERDIKAKERIIRHRFENLYQDTLDDWALRCQDRSLTVMQEAREEEDSDATDDEDNTIPRTYQVDLLTNTRKPVPDEYDSRSRWFLEIQQRWNKTLDRLRLRNLQASFDTSSLTTKPKGFAVFDGAQRDHAKASLNLLQLAEAAEEIQLQEDYARYTKDHLAREPAPGLHALADAIKIHGHGHQAPPNNRLAEDQDAPVQAADTSADVYPSTPRDRNSWADGPGRSPRTALASPQRQEDPTRASLVPLGSFGPRVGLASGKVPPHFQLSASGQSQQPYAGPTHDDRPSSHRDGDYERAWRQQSPTHLYEGNQIGDDSGSRITNASERVGRTRPGPTAVFNSQDDARSRPRDGLWMPNANIMGPPVYLPRYIKDHNLVRQQSPSSSPAASVPAPSKPTEWPGFSTKPAKIHGRGTSYDTQVAQRSSFPTLAPASMLDRSRPRDFMKDTHPSQTTTRNRSTSSPEATRPEQTRPNVSSHSDHTLSLDHPRIAPHRLPNHEGTLPGALRTLRPLRHISPTECNRPPSTPSPGYSPRLTSPTPTSPSAQPIHNEWPGHHGEATPLTPATRTPSPYSQQMNIMNRVYTETPNPNAPYAPSTQLQQSGQTGHQLILPSNMDPNRRPSNNATSPPPFLPNINTTGPSITGPHSHDTRHSLATDKGTSAIPRETSQHPSMSARTNSFRLSPSDPASSGHQQSPQGPPPGQPPFSNHWPAGYPPPPSNPYYAAYPPPPTPASSSGSRRKEPRPPGQLRWQHYANIAPATPGQAGTPLQRRPGQGVPQGQFPAGHSVFGFEQGFHGPGQRPPVKAVSDEEQREIDNAKAKRARNVMGWVAK